MDSPASRGDERGGVALSGKPHVIASFEATKVFVGMAFDNPGIDVADADRELRDAAVLLDRLDHAADRRAVEGLKEITLRSRRREDVDGPGGDRDAAPMIRTGSLIA